MLTKHALKSYISSLLSLIYELKKDVEKYVNYKIIDITQDEKKNVLLKIYVTGKQKLVPCYPRDIVAHDGFLEGFSKIDVRTITYFATQELHAPSLEIIEQKIDPNTNETCFGLSNKTGGDMLKGTAAELSKNPLIIKKMTPLDAHLVGYAACAESMEHETSALALLKSEEKK